MKYLTEGLIATMLMLGTAAAAADTEINETRPVQSDGTVTVTNVSGEIAVSTWDRNEVHLTGTLGSQSELRITESSQGVHIEVDHKDKNQHHMAESELNIVMPATASLIANGVSADITVDDLRGESVSTETVSGDVRVHARVKRVELTSISGDLEFEGTAGRTDVSSVSGDIDLSGIEGEIEISEVSGDTNLKGGAFSLAKFESVSGSLHLNLNVSDGGRLSVESMSGDVILDLPADQAGDFKAQTFSGDLHSRFGEVKRQSMGPGSHLDFVTGNNGVVIRVDSFSGDIDIGRK